MLTPHPHRFLLFAFVLLFWLPPSVGAGQTIDSLRIAGTGDSQELLRAVAHSYMDMNPQVQVGVPDSIGSSGGIKALLAGKADLARVSRDLQEDEISKGLHLIPIALSPVVFVVNPLITGLTDISTSQILAIYNGRITGWRQLGVELDTIYPIGREVGDSSLAVIRKHLPNFDPASPRVKIYYNTLDTVQTLLQYKRTIGYLPLSAAINTELRILRIDSVYPSLQNVREGKYPLVTQLGLVYKGSLSRSARSFVDSIFSIDGMRIIFEHGAIPVIQE